VTAAKHSDQHAAIPGHDETAAMAPAAVYSVLAGDFWTSVNIGRELAGMGATPEEVAATFATMAAAMLQEACGSTVQARQLAERWTRKIAARSARVVLARDADAALYRRRHHLVTLRGAPGQGWRRQGPRDITALPPLHSHIARTSRRPAGSRAGPGKDNPRHPPPDGCLMTLQASRVSSWAPCPRPSVTVTLPVVATNSDEEL